MARRIILVVFLLIFSLFWTALVGFFDWKAGGQIVGQIVSTHFPVATGQITHSEVSTHGGSKKTTFGVDIQYRYDVAGRSFEGRRFRYDDVASSNFAWAQEVVAAHPVGAQTTVFYNPKNPQDAVLSPGLSGEDLMWFLFLTPFNMAMFGLWILVAGRLRYVLVHPVAGGVKIVQDGFRTKVRLPEFPAIAVGMITTGGVGFVEIFLVGFTFKFHPPLGIAGLALAVAYGAGAAAYLWQRRKIESGEDDLIIDAPSRTVQLPKTFQRKERVTAAFSDISAVIVETVVNTNGKGGTSYSYAPSLRLRNKESTCERLADWSDADRAQSFATWLREQLGC